MHSATPAATLTEADILAALRDCYAPDVPLNILDLGLVHSVTLAPDPDAPGSGVPGVPARHRVAIALTLAQVADVDVDGSPLIAQIQNRLAGFQTISHTEVLLLSEPAWNPGRISPEGRARLAGAVPTNRKQTDGLIQIKLQS